MENKFIYTNSIGSFLIGADRVLNKILFTDIIDSNRKIRNQEWLEEEKQLVRAVHEKVIFLGHRKDKIPNVIFSNDLRKLETANRLLSKYENDINQTVLKLAKADIKDSIGPDELIIQVAGTLQALDKSTTLLTKTVREWNGLRNPELSSTVHDDAKFVKLVLEGTEQSEMGAVLTTEDCDHIIELSKKILLLQTLRHDQVTYLEAMMKRTCPNLLTIAGAMLGSKLLEAAGSLRRLALLPASTVQILGAEKSMFNFLRNKTKKMPRFGILHEHKFIMSAKENKKGRVARLLADKISIACRVDYFKGAFIGDKLLNEIIEKLR